ncbi:hypothetical protein [Roseobacter sp. HKCC-CH-9208]|uniref:hypothetical protein n=1 Tax=Roseobacter sp. HKCC-CH-9208 TaxID=3120339 RepID=UPI0030ECFC4E
MMPYPLPQRALPNLRVLSRHCALGQSVARIDGQLFITRRFPILGPVGYCAKLAHIPASLLSGASPQGMAHVLINAATPAQGAVLARAGFLRLAKPRQSLSVPLTQNPAEMVARLHPKWRAARKTVLAPLHRLARQTQQPRAGGRNGGNL